MAGGQYYYRCSLQEPPAAVLNVAKLEKSGTRGNFMSARTLAGPLLTFVMLAALVPAARSGSSSDAGGGEQGRWTAGAHCFRYVAASGSQLRFTSPDCAELSSGRLLVEAQKAGVVVTPLADIYVKRKALVLLRVQQSSTRCLVLWDNGFSSVSVLCNKKHVRLGPGHEVLVTDHSPDYREIAQEDEIGRRTIKVHQVGGGRVVTTAEFSLLHALERDPLLYSVFQDPQEKDRQLKERIVKTAAVLNLVTARHGYYTTGTRF